MNRKIWLGIGAVSLVIIIGLGGFYFWFLKQRSRIITGTARPSFPYTDYSIDDLNKMYPQTMFENVATTQTPEQTHAKFIAALKKEDFEEAVNCCFFEEDREKMLVGLDKVKGDGRLDVMISDLSVIQKQMLLDTIATYGFLGTSNGKKVGGVITFNKDEKGVWRIKSL